jgi:hypothetical protein
LHEFLPTVHGFDEWFGNLYHLNAEEEPEELDYPGQKNPAYLEKFGPRGVLHTWAASVDDPTNDPYKVHLDGYNNLAHWTGQSEKSSLLEIFYYDETDLMAVRVDGWKMHIGVKHKGSWFDEKSYPSVPYLVNLLMDPMEKMTPDSEEWGYIARKFVAQKLWAPTAAVPFLMAHLKSLADFPPSQGADTLSMKKAIENVMKQLENPKGGNQ